MKNLVLNYENYLIKIKNLLHSYPELSGQEENTFKFIRDELSSFGLNPIKVGDYNIIAKLDLSKDHTLLLRADMDGLPIEENKTGKEVYSLESGVSHSCGHDAHMAILLTVAKIICENNLDLNTNLIFCFESGEEKGIGVESLIPYLKKQDIDAVWAMHVSPVTEVGLIEACPREVMTGSARFKVDIQGKGGHGAIPHESKDPIPCLVDILSSLRSINSRMIDPRETLVLSIGMIKAGDALNVIPDTASFGGTIRFYKPDIEKFVRAKLISILDSTTKIYDCSYQLEYLGPKPSVINSKELFELARFSIEKELGKDNFREVGPMLPSETIGRYFKYFPGVYVFLGTKDKNQPVSSCHNPNFNIDNSSLKYGVLASLAFVSNINKKHRE